MSELRSVDIKSVDDFATDYDVKHKIGEGMFSNVWLCIQRDNGQEYAAKILKNNYGSTMNADDWNSIIELNVAKTVLKHPFLLMLERCYHERSGPGRVIMVSELMKRSLYDVIEAGECPLPANRIKSYTYQLLEGVKYMHENGFIHRDIKPENILLKDKLLKLADFGTACHVTAGQPYTSYVATRWYRSPECLLTSGWYGTKMDIWSVGCVLYEIATGRPLFDGENEYDQVDKIDRVLGRPDARLMCKFKKHSSDIFDQQYNNSTATRTGARGIGLHTVYKPFWPSYDVLKDMITYDPAKRYSADRLLRKPYFQEMKNTEYDYKIKKFQEAAMKNSRRPTKNNSSGEGKLDLPKRIPLSSIDKKHEGGDHVQQTSRERCMTQNVKKGQETHSFNKNQQSGGKNTIASDINRKQMPKTMTGIIAKSNNNLPLKKQYINSIPKLSRNPLINPNVKSKSLMKRPPFK